MFFLHDKNQEKLQKRFLGRTTFSKMSKSFFKFPNSALISAFASQMALIGLFLPPFASAWIRTHVSRVALTQNLKTELLRRGKCLEF